MGDLAELSRDLVRDGYVLLRSAIDRKVVDALQEDAEREVDLAVRQAGDLSRCDGGWFSPSGALFSDGEGHRLIQVQLTYRTSAAVLQAALSSVVLDVLEQVIGRNIELFGEGQGFVKMPGGGGSKHLHQDDAYFVHREKSQYAALTYLQDVDEKLGALQVIPGSHLAGGVEHGPSSSHLSAIPDQLRVQDVVTVPGHAGDVILFHGLTLHGSGANESDSPRVVVVNRYRSVNDGVLSSRVTADGPEVPHLDGRQEGVVVRGHRSLENADGWAWPIAQQRVFPV